MINCEVCNTPVDPMIVNSQAFSSCENCNARIRTDVFPAAVRVEKADIGSKTLVIEDDAGCYYHPSKQAVIPCSACGRFLCTLCDIDMDGKHICFPCMESKQKKNQSNQLETHRFLYDSLALWLCILPVITVFVFWVSIFTAPAAFYITIRHWNSRGSIAPRGKRWRSVLALVLSSAQIVSWIGLAVYLIQLKSHS